METPVAIRRSATPLGISSRKAMQQTMATREPMTTGSVRLTGVFGREHETRCQAVGVVANDRLAERQDLPDTLVHQAVPVEPALDLGLHVAAPAQASEVRGHTALGETELGNELGHGARPLGEELEGPHPVGIGEALEERRQDLGPVGQSSGGADRQVPEADRRRRLVDDAHSPLPDLRTKAL